MRLIGRSHPVEMLAEWGAPTVLALAAGWSARLAGLPLVAVVAGAFLALAVGVIAMRVTGPAPLEVVAGFEPAAIEATDDDELLLDEPLVELLLEDRLDEVDPASRVVQLFARQDPTPGELVLRIADYLNDGTRAAEAAPVPQSYPDASASLHAALANIRASLR